MTDKLTYLKNHSAIKTIIIPMILILFGIVLIWLHLIFSPYSYTVTISPHSESMEKLLGRPLLASQKFNSSVVAKENHLGIVTVRFYLDRLKVRNTLAFRIKEKGAADWYYENQYDTRQFYTLPFYPFGFPPIDNSKGKEYEFEIESLDGSPKNSVYISTVEPNLVLSYQYSKEELLNNHELLLYYSIHKIQNAVLYMDMGFAILVYFIPFLFYILWHVELKKFVHLKKTNDRYGGIQMNIMSRILHIKTASIFHIVLLIVTFTDVFYIRMYYDLVIVVLFAMWVGVTKMNKFQSNYLYMLAIMFLGITSIANIFSITVAGKAAVWAFMFLILGVGGDIYEIMKTRKVAVKTYEEKS